MISAPEHRSVGRSVLDHQPTPEDAAEHRIAVLSAALLQAVMTTYGEDHETFAARAGIAAIVGAAAAAGTCPAWELPYDEYTALADAVATLWPCALFETATACDLLLTNVINGDHFMATDVLADPSAQGLALALLRAAESLLPENLQSLLRKRAAELADSTSPDAWVGEQIISGLIGRQS
jgi:hypothetical protein